MTGRVAIQGPVLFSHIICSGQEVGEEPACCGHGIGVRGRHSFMRLADF